MPTDVDYRISRKPVSADHAGVQAFSPDYARAVRAFHATLPGYRPTPLHTLSALAGSLGLGALYVKDESFRFGLKAFKVLGASYAMARVAAERLGLSPETLDFASLTTPEARARLAGLTFATATDGNHGRAVAWTARQLGLPCVVHMPKGSSLARLESIRAEGARAEILDRNYDQAVLYTAELSEKNGWTLVQDTAFEGYERIPGWIMQGYATLVGESLEQLGPVGPTHVVVQAGVGSLAAAVLGSFTARLGDARPVFVVAEARAADCLYRSAGEGAPVTVEGDLETIMAGLACGCPSATAWPLLRDLADAFVSCGDAVAARGMRMLGNPLGEDPRVVSGESGALPLGLVARIMADPDLAGLRAGLGLDRHSRVLVVSTEGDTDPERYRRIVWDGEFSSTGA